MKQLLTDYTFSDKLHYNQHTLIYGTDDPIRIEGAFGAALLCALLVDTEEGNQRGIAIDSDEDKQAWIKQYEREVRREGWGLIEVEVRMLAEAYEQLTLSQDALNDICHHNILLFDLAYGLLVHYMNHLVREECCMHIWEYTKWENPFSQWLIKAVYDESVRQAMLHIDWLDPAIVTALPTQKTPTMPTLSFEGEAAEDIMNRYYDWLWSSLVAQTSEQPDAKIQLEQGKADILESETHFAYLNDKIALMDAEDQVLFRKWMSGWIAFINSKLKPEKQITFWTNDVTEEKQEALLDYLKIQERQPQRYKCLAVAVYSLRQLGYITYNIAPSSIAKWLSERLQNDYSSKTGLYQFRRAWNELSRFNPAVKDEVEHLAELGVKSIK